jgi:putative ABC transport system permease protein
MIRNYIKVALRNLRRNKLYTALNVTGLGIGIACGLLIFMIIKYETSYDNFHKNRERIYRIGTSFEHPDGIDYSAGVCFPAAEALRMDFPQLEKVAGIFQRGQTIVSTGNITDKQKKKFNETRVYFAEPSFFEIFNFSWLAGTPQTALADPGSVAITREIAEKYFGNWKYAMGQTLTFNNSDVYKVNGVIDNVPVNTDFPLGLVASYASLKNTGVAGNLNDWVSTYSEAEVFVTLPKNMSIDKFSKDLIAFSKRHKKPEYMNILVAQPLSDIHFNAEFGNFNDDRTFSKTLITAITLIGIFLIVIACVNFINLSTAQAVNRSKEVGVRKVMGSTRRQLAFQFISETAIITLFAAVLAMIIAFYAMSFINNLLEIKLSLSLISIPLLLCFMAGLIILVTLLSGIYPAIIVSGFNPITALKNTLNAKAVGGISLRRALVILQFAIAHVLIIATIVVVSQTDYFRTASMGFTKDAILNVAVPGDSISRTKQEYLRNEFLKNPAIEKAAFSFASPADNGMWNSDFRYDHSTKSTDFSANLKWADPEYFNVYNLQFIAGKPYEASDTVTGFVVNETLLKRLGITDPNQAIGKEINLWDGARKANITGVVRDFNSVSLRSPVAPVLMGPWKDLYGMVSLHISPGKTKETLDYIESIWNKTFPDYVYRFEFLDKKIDGFYRQENQLSSLYKLFAIIAIFISCLGLYGLVSFMAVQRIKEVGIRKVLGASVGHIIYLFSREFTILILVAFAIAAPVAWYFMHKWLQDFTYRIPLTATIFLVSIAGSLAIAWITVGYRSIKAAIINPVKSLRTE